MVTGTKQQIFDTIDSFYSEDEYKKNLPEDSNDRFFKQLFQFNLITFT